MTELKSYAAPKIELPVDFSKLCRFFVGMLLQLIETKLSLSGRTYNKRKQAKNSGISVRKVLVCLLTL